MHIWPFRKKKDKFFDVNANDEVSSLHNKNLRHAKTSIMGASVTAFLLLVGAGTSIGISCWQAELGNDFSKSYNLRVELSLTDENSLHGSDRIVDGNHLKEYAENSASAYSKYLAYKGIDNVAVFPEYIRHDEPDNPDQQDHIYLNFNVPNEKYWTEYGLEKKIQIDKDPSTLWLEYALDNRLTAIVENWENDQSPHFTIIPLNKYIDSKFTKIHSDNKNQVDIRLNTSFGGTNGIIDNVLDSTTDSNGDSGTNNSTIYIVRNYSGLLNYLSYIFQIKTHLLWSEENNPYEYTTSSTSNPPWYNDQTTWDDLDLLLETQNQGENDFWESFTNHEDMTREEEDFLDWNCDLTSRLYTTSDDSGHRAYTEETNSGLSIKNFQISDNKAPLPSTPYERSINSPASLLFSSSVEWNDGVPKLSSSGVINYEFLKKFIIGFGKSDAKENRQPTGDSFLNLIPLKDPTKATDNKNFHNSDDRWLTIKCPNRNEAQLLYNDINSYALPLPIKVCNTSWSTSGGSSQHSTLPTVVAFKNGTIPIASTLNNNAIFSQVDSFTGIIIALCFIILAVGILVSVLYRVPGFLAMIGTICAFGLTLMTMLLTNFTLSLSMLMGLLVGLLGTIIATILACERVKRLTRSGVPFEVAVRKGIKQAFWTMLDFHFIFLLVGIGVSYFCTVQVTALGNALLLFALFSFVCICLLWPLMMLLLFTNRIGAKSMHFFLKERQQTSVKVLEDKSYETVYGGRFATKKFTVFGWKQILIAAIVGAIALLGVILILFVGVHSSYFFYGGTRIMIDSDNFSQWNTYFASGWSEKVVEGRWIFLYFDHQVSAAQYGLPNGTLDVSVFFQSITSDGAIGLATNGIYAILIISGFICIYSFIRLNWVTTIPMFLGLVLTPMTCIGLIAIFQVYFDLYIVLALIIIYTINALIVISYIGMLNNTFLRKNILQPANLRKVMNAEVKNSLLVYLKIYAMLIGTFIILLIFCSKDLAWFNIIVMIGIASSVLVLYAIVPFVLMLFIRIRYRYILSSSNISNPLLRKNYDQIDEQLIENINTFKKKKITI